MYPVETSTKQITKKRLKETRAPSLKVLEFASLATDIALEPRATYKLRISYKVLATTMRTAICIFSTGASRNVVRSEKIPQKLGTRMKRNSVPSLRITARQALALAGSILLHLWVGVSQKYARCTDTLRLATNLLIDISFIDRFIRKVSPLKQKIEPLLSRPVTILVQQRHFVAVTAHILHRRQSRTAVHKVVQG